MSASTASMSGSETSRPSADRHQNFRTGTGLCSPRKVDTPSWAGAGALRNAAPSSAPPAPTCDPGTGRGTEGPPDGAATARPRRWGSRAVLELLVFPCRTPGRWGARARGRSRDGSTRTVRVEDWDREEALRSAVRDWYAAEEGGEG